MATELQFNIADLFESLVDAIPDRPAVVCGERRLTFAELDERANRVANALRTRGVGPGQHVGLHLYNSTEFLEAMLAAFKLRAVPINLNYRYVAKELRYLLDNADLVAVVSQRELAPVVAEAREGIEALHTVILVDDGAEMPSEGFEDYDTVLEESSPARDFGPRSNDDLYIIYTGGTTGMPKGVMWRHEDVFFAGLQGGRPGGEPIKRPEELADAVTEPDKALNMMPAAPFIHGAAQWGALIGMFTGGKIVLVPGRSFDAEMVCRLVGDEKITTITLVGDAMARPLVEALEAPGASYDLSSLAAIASAGAVLSPAVRERLQELVPNAIVLNNFGSTEAGHQGSAIPGSDKGVEGRPSFFMDPTNTVLDENLEPIEPGSGKIGKLARGGRVPLGYYKDPKKTAERFVEVKGKRWTIPGDLGTIEADGRITVFGRGSVCINTGGEKVFPEEVEEALKAHPDVFDALVVGVPDERWMQRVAAVIEPREGKKPTLEEIQAHCREHVAGYKVPRQVTLVEKIQRQPSGKPDYAWARDAAIADQGEAAGTESS